MEYENGEPHPGMLGCDRDLFSRVWARVEPNAGEGCPIEVLPPQNLHLPQSRPTPPPAAVDRVGEDGLLPNDVPCLGKEGAEHTGFLQQAMGAALQSRRRYQTLAARGGMAGRTLAALSAAKRQHARRLAGAYFLISGIRFLPETQSTPKIQGNFWGEIRKCFWQEQQTAALFAAAAEETSDRCLAQLYRELAAESAAHADLLRTLTEQM